MNNKTINCMKYILYLFGSLMVAFHVQAASFDCSKATTAVEHLICDNTEISKLDDELAVSYKTALQDKSKVEVVGQEQKQWIKDRNRCMVVACLKTSYETRLSALSTDTNKLKPSNAVQETPKSRKNVADMDKIDSIRRIVTSHEFKLTNNYATDKGFCGRFISDFGQMRGIEFAAPTVTSERFDDPVWNRFKAMCPQREFFGGYACDARIAEYIDGLPKSQQEAATESMCDLYRGTGKFKMFTVDINDNPKDGPETVFYTEHEQGPINRSGRKLVDANGGYVIVDLRRCQMTGALQTHDQFSYDWHHSLNNYNGIISYKGKYYIFDLFELDVKTRTPEDTVYDLKLSSYTDHSSKATSLPAMTCDFSSLKPAHLMK